MKKFLLGFIMLVSVSAAFAQPSKPATEIIALKETVYDFGKIQQGRPVTHDFFVTNSSTSEVLKLENVQASCGCTTPEWKKDPVEPGASTKIIVGYNAYAEGPFEKLVTVTYNNGQTKTITIKGNVYKSPASSAPENSSVQILKQSN